MDCITERGHECKKGFYRDYCCGENYQQNQFFKDNPNALVFQLYTDDFEVCEAIKPKQGLHKKCAFYMMIRNMPRKLQSKLSNIFLIALADSIDLKSESASIENILDVILEDFKIMETVGVNVNGNIIKGCLFTMSFDNLGANVCYGLVQSFNANYFCRFCECHHNECKTSTKDNPDKIRNIDSYNAMCARILKENDLDVTETKGVRSYCKLNDLSNFHILKNYTVDIMHDLLEGAVPYTLHIIFETCLEKKLFKSPELQNMIQFYNYGYLNKRNCPSKLRMNSKNLGQNATQLHCLIKNLPFILYGYKDDLKDVWILVESLLQILEIVFSEDLRDIDLHRLKKSIECHLKFIVDVLKKDLIPKHHFLLHYSMVIQAMGPLIFTCAMRLEAKHQELKSTAQKTNNYINLNKTIAEKHQMLLSLRENQFCDEIETGKVVSSFEGIDDFEIYKSLLIFALEGNENVVKLLKINSLTYKPGLLILSESQFFEIKYILQCSNSYWLLCENTFNVTGRDSFCNSLILEQISDSKTALNVKQLSNMNPYQKVFIRGTIHIISDHLDLFKLIPS